MEWYRRPPLWKFLLWKTLPGFIAVLYFFLPLPLAFWLGVAGMSAYLAVGIAQFSIYRSLPVAFRFPEENCVEIEYESGERIVSQEFWFDGSFWDYALNVPRGNSWVEIRMGDYGVNRKTARAWKRERKKWMAAQKRAKEARERVEEAVRKEIAG